MTYIRITLTSIIFALISSIALSEDFKIISFKGVVETSFDQKIWNIVEDGELVKTGSWIRTGPKASAIILLPNRTQTKISRNAEFQLNYQAKEEKTQVNLKLGKIWSKTNKKPAKITVKAPNAVASIRGTEWVIEVLEDSSSSLAVLEGERLDFLIFAYSDDPFNRPEDLNVFVKSNNVYPKIIGYSCKKGHFTYRQDCKSEKTYKEILNFFQASDY